MGTSPKKSSEKEEQTSKNSTFDILDLFEEDDDEKIDEIDKEVINLGFIEDEDFE